MRPTARPPDPPRPTKSVGVTSPGRMFVMRATVFDRDAQSNLAPGAAVPARGAPGSAGRRRSVSCYIPAAMVTTQDVSFGMLWAKLIGSDARWAPGDDDAPPLR